MVGVVCRAQANLAIRLTNSPNYQASIAYRHDGYVYVKGTDKQTSHPFSNNALLKVKVNWDLGKISFYLNNEKVFKTQDPLLSSPDLAFVINDYYQNESL